MSRRRTSVRTGAATALLIFAALGFDLASTASIKAQNKQKEDEITPLKMVTPEMQRCNALCESRTTACMKAAKAPPEKENCERFSYDCKTAVFNNGRC